MTLSDKSDDNVSNILNSIGTPLKASQEGFSERLKTYSASTFFAKPTELSPIVCASMG